MEAFNSDIQRGPAPTAARAGHRAVEVFLEIFKRGFWYTELYQTPLFPAF